MAGQNMAVCGQGRSSIKVWRRMWLAVRREALGLWGAASGKIEIGDADSPQMKWPLKGGTIVAQFP